MKKIAAFVLLAVLCVGGCVPALAKTQKQKQTNKYQGMDRASRKAQRKEQKAMEKYANKQQKAQRKMLKGQKKSKYQPVKAKHH